MYTLPIGHRVKFGAAIYVNHSTKELDEVVIDMAKVSHKLNLIKVI